MWDGKHDGGGGGGGIKNLRTLKQSTHEELSELDSLKD